VKQGERKGRSVRPLGGFKKGEGRKRGGFETPELHREGGFSGMRGETDKIAGEPEIKKTVWDGYGRGPGEKGRRRGEVGGDVVDLRQRVGGGEIKYVW